VSVVLYLSLAALGGRPARAADPAPPVKLSARDTLAYVGTFTKGEARGIYAFRVASDPPRGDQPIRLEPLGLAAETPNPGFLVVDPRRRVVFAANDIHEFEGKPSGAVSAFAVDAASGKLTLLGQRPSGGPAPCNMVLDGTRKHLLVTNCIGGSVAVLPVAADGRLGPASQLVQHPGTKPHTHGIALSPDNRFAYACDMGLDRIMAYRFDARTGKLTPAATPIIAVKPGTGPRHLVFRPDGRFAYVVGTRASTLTVFTHDPGTGALAEVQTISTLPPGFKGTSTAAELKIDPAGNHLYVSNRGRDSVALFTVDPARGTLSYVEDQASGGKTPRHFTLDPTAKHVTIANQDSGTVMVARIDAGSGRLKPSAVTASVPSPVVVDFLPPR
jgi:6-phosphogluconolactonase